jgi:hypothetical protein
MIPNVLSYILSKEVMDKLNNIFNLLYKTKYAHIILKKLY